MRRLRSILALLVVLAVPSALPARQDSAHGEAYREGQRALDAGDWDRAAQIFGKIAATPGDERDAALYWKAYADAKRNRKQAALEGLGKLLSTYPKSAWADDAKTLQLELRDGGGAEEVEAAGDDDLKLYALDGLMQAEPAKAVPILEKLLAGGASPRVKERALFVLSQSDSPQARAILLRVAKTGQPMELRREAVKTLGIAGLTADLAEVARDKTAPREVRLAVVEAYLIANHPDSLVEIATSDPDPEVRERAIDALGAIGALPSLRRLWTTEKDPELKQKLLQAFGVAGDIDTLAKVARESPDPEIRRKAIEGIGIAGGKEGSATLRRLYTELPGQDDKRKIAQSLMIAGDARALVDLFRAEKDPALKKTIVQQLSLMDDPEATRILLEVLGEKP